jgi:hypothetical protein
MPSAHASILQLPTLILFVRDRHPTGRCTTRWHRNSPLNSSKRISLETFEAMLYWKLYSQPAAIANTCKRLMQDGKLRREASQGLVDASTELRKAQGPGLNQPGLHVRKLGTYEIWGMKSSTALPVRTTFLHFVHAATVPIFDKQVLFAVGVSEKRANESLTVLEAYTGHARGLAVTHSAHFSQFHNETHVRLVDMALWVVRGGCR